MVLIYSSVTKGGMDSFGCQPKTKGAIAAIADSLVLIAEQIIPLHPISKHPHPLQCLKINAHENASRMGIT
jgi:hypothetical protein